MPRRWWGSVERRKATTGAERLAGIVRRIGEHGERDGFDRALLDAALDASGCDSGELTRAGADGRWTRVATRGGARPATPELVRDLSVGARALGRLTVWGGSPDGESSAALDLVASHAAQALESTRLRDAADERRRRERRIGGAVSAVGRSRARGEALAQVVRGGRALLGARGAVLLRPNGDGAPAVIASDGAADLGGVVLEDVLPVSLVSAAAGGECWSGPADPHGVGGDSRPAGLALVPLAHGALALGALAVLAAPGQMIDADQLEALRDYAGRAAAAVGSVSMAQELRELATIDPVTRLYNGRYFAERLDQEMNRSVRGRRPISVLVMAIDGLDVARAQGRDADADEALVELALLVGRHRRAMDVACRLGGDEIALILPDARGMEAFVAGERLRRTVASEAPLAAPRTLSIGASCFPESAGSREEMTGAARAALCWARRHGGDRTFLYDREVAASLEAEERERRASDEALLTTVYALAAAVDARDRSTQHHSQNVAQVAALIARQIGLPLSRAEEVRVAGLLHDVGKIGVSDGVLRKPGPLSDEEWVEMRQHPAIGHRILSGTGLETIRPWVLHHHERMDGRGYPGGLVGAEIPIEARIICVADALDAMTQERSYRPAMGFADALAELERCAGSHFDPSVVSALRELASLGVVDGLVPLQTRGA